MGVHCCKDFLSGSCFLLLPFLFCCSCVLFASGFLISVSCSALCFVRARAFCHLLAAYFFELVAFRFAFSLRLSVFGFLVTAFWFLLSSGHCFSVFASCLVLAIGWSGVESSLAKQRLHLQREGRQQYRQQQQTPSTTGEKNKRVQAW